MIRIRNTPNFAGVHIFGDYSDFDELYEAVHRITRSHEEDDGYGQPRRRILSLFSELRQAQLGNRGIEAVPNGFSEGDDLGIPVESGNNVYLRFEALWPEVLFAAFALNDFISHYMDGARVHSWDPSAAHRYTGNTASAEAAAPPQASDPRRSAHRCVRWQP